MNIKQMLHQKSRKELESMRNFWIPGQNIYTSTATLRPLLTRIMKNPTLVVEMYSKLSTPEKEVIRVLLGTKGYTDTASAVLGRCNLKNQSKAAWRVLFSLEWKGFITLFSPNGTWRGKRSEAAIPIEIAEMLQKYIHLEARPLKSLLSLQEYLETNPEESRRFASLIDGSGELDNSQLFERLTAFATIEKRIEAIEDDKLKRAIYLAIQQHCGLLSVSRMSADLRAAAAEKKEQWQEMLERQFLGTLRNISLVEYGIALDGEHIVIFQEIVEGYIRGMTISEEKFDRIDSAGLDFITDISIIINFVMNNEVKLTQTGTLYKRASKKIQAAITQKPNFLVDESMLLGLKIAACFNLGILTADSNNRVTVTKEAVEWENLDLVRKLKSVFNTFQLHRGSRFANMRYNPLRQMVFDVIKTLEVNRWYPRLSISHLSMCKHLLRLIGDVSARSNIYRFHSGMDIVRLFTMDIKDMCEGLFGHISPVMVSFGMIDLGIRGNSISSIRLTEIGAWILGLSKPKMYFELSRENDDREGEERREKLLIINPDFEVLLFPGENHLQLSYQLSRFCRREKSDQIMHFKITKESIETAALNGITPEMILSLLKHTSRNPIPQNVAYSIREWGEKIQIATVSTVQLLEAQDAKAMEKLLSLKEIQSILVRQLSPTAIIVSEQPRHQRTIEAMQKVGVYLR